MRAKASRGFCRKSITVCAIPFSHGMLRSSNGSGASAGAAAGTSPYGGSKCELDGGTGGS